MSEPKHQDPKMVAIEQRIRILTSITRDGAQRSRRLQDYYFAALNELMGVKQMLDGAISVREWEQHCHRPDDRKRKPNKEVAMMEAVKP